MDISDILYVVVTIVIVLSGFLKKKKKNQINTAQQEYSEENYSPMYTESEPEQDTGSHRFDGVADYEGTPTTAGYDDIEKAHEKLIQKEAKLSGKGKSRAKSKKEIKKEQKNKGAGFDARKAIIYSTILERKKY